MLKRDYDRQQKERYGKLLDKNFYNDKKDVDSVEFTKKMLSSKVSELPAKPSKEEEIKQKARQQMSMHLDKEAEKRDDSDDDSSSSEDIYDTAMIFCKCKKRKEKKPLKRTESAETKTTESKKEK